MKELDFARKLGTRLFLTAVFLMTLIASAVSPVAAAAGNDKDDNGARSTVYTMTNAAAGNDDSKINVERGTLVPSEEGTEIEQPTVSSPSKNRQRAARRQMGV